MNVSWKLLRRISVVSLVGLVLAGCASGPNNPSPEIAQRIEAARTREDHEGLAAYYGREAALARAKAAEHRKMARSYQGMVTSGRGGANMPAHCNSIVNLYENMAIEYDSLAADHRQMTKTAPL